MLPRDKRVGDGDQLETRGSSVPCAEVTWRLGRTQPAMSPERLWPLYSGER